MSFKKPFKAVPLKPSKRILEMRQAKQRAKVTRILLLAAVLGFILGSVSVAVSQEQGENAGLVPKKKTKA